MWCVTVYPPFHGWAFALFPVFSILNIEKWLITASISFSYFHVFLQWEGIEVLEANRKNYGK